LSAGTIFDIKKFAIHDGPGVRTTVFLKGCPMGCWLCHNPESQASSRDLLLRQGRCDVCGDCVDVCSPVAISLNENSVRIDRSRCDLCGACVDACLRDALEIAGREVTAAEVMEEVEKDAVFYDESGGGITFSGGEPLSQPEFLLELLRSCRIRGFRTALDTCGHAEPEILRQVAEHVDLFLYDLKLIDDARHLQFTGTSNRSIHQNLRWLAEQDADVLIRFPLLPGINDDEDNIDALGSLLSSMPVRYGVDILPYHRLGVDKYDRLDRDHKLPELRPPTQKQITEVAGRLKGYGLHVMVKGEEI